MDLENLFREIKIFSQETHGSTSYDKEALFVAGRDNGEFAPVKYLLKKFPELQGAKDFLGVGFIYDSYDLHGNPAFLDWYERQFSRKLPRNVAKDVEILQIPNNKLILSSIGVVHDNYEVLRQQKILMNSKNLPVQLGEWYAKSIFGLRQVKSTSQRGFDFQLDGKRVEVKVDWGDHSSPKGVKLRKTLVELSDYCIIIYVANSFTIREICFLDSDFVLRKFGDKGHTIFLKDSSISTYFFSNSTKHNDKVSNSTALLKYASPTLAMKLVESFQKN